MTNLIDDIITVCEMVIHDHEYRFCDKPCNCLACQAANRILTEINNKPAKDEKSTEDEKYLREAYLACLEAEAEYKKATEKKKQPIVAYFVKKHLSSK